MLTRRRLLAGSLAVPARSLLAVPAVALVNACSADSVPVGPTQDETARDAARAAEQQLLDRYAATLTAHPDLADRLGPVRDEHVAHLQALAPPPSSGSPSPTATSASRPPVDVAADPDTAVRALVAAESAAAAARGGQVPMAGPELAVLLASIGASEQTHAVWLGG